MTQGGLRAVLARLLAAAKEQWFEEQRELHRQEREAREAASTAGQPLGSVNLDMLPRELATAALELVRADDNIAMQHLINEASNRARRFIEAGEIEDELGALLDRLICLAATFLEYEQWEWLSRIIEVLREIYSMPLGEGDAQRMGFSTGISPREPGPRVWLQLMTRLYALGALAVRRRHWTAVRELSLQLPDRLMDYKTNWLRHAITMMSRAQHLQGQQEGQAVEVSLLSLAVAQAARLECLRTDGTGEDDERLLSSLAQFDVLSNIVAVADAPQLDFGKTFYPNFARLRQDRVQPLVEGLLSNNTMRGELGVQDDELLAYVLRAIESVAHQQGIRYHGFRSWDYTPVGEFIAEHLPSGS